MATIPVPRTWAVTDDISAARLNTEVRDAENFLLAYPQLAVTNGAVVTHTTGTQTLLAWDTETYDTDVMHDTATNNSRLKAPTAGMYSVEFNITYAANATGVRSVNLRLNSAGSSVGGTSLQIWRVNATSASAATVTGTWRQRMAAADYVELFGLQTSGGNLDMSIGSAAFMTMWAV